MVFFAQGAGFPPCFYTLGVAITRADVAAGAIGGAIAPRRGRLVPLLRGSGRPCGGPGAGGPIARAASEENWTWASQGSVLGPFGCAGKATKKITTLGEHPFGPAAKIVKRVSHLTPFPSTRNKLFSF